MTWDSTWEAVHQSREWGYKPLPDFSGFMLRHCQTAEKAKTLHVLDVGCGGGASTIFLARHGFNLHAFDGSQSAVELTRRRLADHGLSADLRVMDAARIAEEFEPESMDWVLDVASLQCCRPAEQRLIVDQIRRVLKPGGLFYSRMAATGSWGEESGELIADHTYTDITEGPARGIGVQYFATREHILSLYVDWLYMDGHFFLDNRSTPQWDHWWLEWVVEGVKI